MGRGSSKAGGGSTGNVGFLNARTLYFDGRKATVYDNPLPLAPDGVIDAYQWDGNDEYEVKGIVDHRVNGIGYGRIESIPVSKLGSMQDFIEVDRVKSIMNSGTKPDEIKGQNKTSGITGFLYNGKVYIYDGNHRAIAAMLNGQKEVKVEIDREIKKRK